MFFCLFDRAFDRSIIFLNMLNLPSRCFVIDLSGFLITHKSFLDNPPQNKVHLVSVEPEVANDLFVAGFFVQDSCLKYVDVTEQLFWQVYRR